MGAGKPDYQKLMELGKLPKDARGNVPFLAQLDKAEKRIKELEAEIAFLKDSKEEGEGNEEVKRGRGRPPKVNDAQAKDEVE